MNFKKSWFSCVLILSFVVGCNSQAQKTNLPVNEFEKKITTGKFQLLDVRTADEFENGHLKNSLQADWNNEEQFKQRVGAMNKDIPVYTYCLSGARSGAATKWLNENGYTAFNLEGGINSWNNAGKPVEQKVKLPQITMAEYLAQIPLDKTVLVDFSAEWCPPCKKMEPVLSDLQKTHGDRFIFLKIDGATQTDLLKEMNIEEFPSFILYKNGKAVWKKTGLVEKAEFTNLL